MLLAASHDDLAFEEVRLIQAASLVAPTRGGAGLSSCFLSPTIIPSVVYGLDESSF